MPVIRPKRKPVSLTIKPRAKKKAAMPMKRAEAARKFIKSQANSSKPVKKVKAIGKGYQAASDAGKIISGNSWAVPSKAKAKKARIPSIRSRKKNRG